MRIIFKRVLCKQVLCKQALAALVVSLPLITLPANAHEFWLDPVDFTPKKGAEVPIVHRTGVNFLGDSFPFVRSVSERFAVIDARGERSIKAVEGDDPAADVKLPNAGLAIIAYQRARDNLVHPTIETFAEILAVEGLGHIADQHRTAGLPLTGIRESYARYAKSLLMVGHGKGSDRAVGLPFEIVIDGNPYDLVPNAPLKVQVLHQGRPVENVLVKAFSRVAEKSPRQSRTDAEGRVQLDGVPAGEVLVSAVMMVRSENTSVSDWFSLWATVTFKRP